MSLATEADQFANWQAFFEVTLPLSLPGLAAGSLLCFVFSAGTFVTPQILGGPPGYMFGNLIFDALMDEINWPMGATLSFVMLIMLGTIVIICNRIMGLSQIYGMLRNSISPEINALGTVMILITVGLPLLAGGVARYFARSQG